MEKKKNETLIITYKADTRQVKAATRDLKEMEKIILRLKKNGISITINVV